MQNHFNIRILFVFCLCKLLCVLQLSNDFQSAKFNDNYARIYEDEISIYAKIRILKEFKFSKKTSSCEMILIIIIITIVVHYTGELFRCMVSIKIKFYDYRNWTTRLGLQWDILSAIMRYKRNLARPLQFRGYCKLILNVLNVLSETLVASKFKVSRFHFVYSTLFNSGTKYIPAVEDVTLEGGIFGIFSFQSADIFSNF